MILRKLTIGRANETDGMRSYVNTMWKVIEPELGPIFFTSDMFEKGGISSFTTSNPLFWLFEIYTRNGVETDRCAAPIDVSYIVTLTGRKIIQQAVSPGWSRIDFMG
jgi:hypothetical protein